MFYINGGDIYIQRGDSASFDIVFGEANAEELGENYISVSDVYGINWIPEDGTHIRFSVKVDTEKYRCLIQKDYVVMNGFVTIDLMSRDTRDLPSNQYVWDVRLSFDNADFTDWNTPFNPFPFYVCDVVSNSN